MDYAAMESMLSTTDYDWVLQIAGEQAVLQTQLRAALLLASLDSISTSQEGPSTSPVR